MNGANMYKLSKRSLRELIGVHPELGFMCTEAITITDQDFMIFDGIRTEKEQSEMVKRGASKTMKSYHLWGLAVDLVPYINGPRWEHKPLDKVAKACKQVIKAHGLHIDNGFDLWGWDKPHWQMTGYKSKYDYRKLL